MPLWYKGIIEEHNAVRNAAGLFDVSHMGRFAIKGRDASAFLNYLLPSDVKNVKSDRAFYSTICNDEGGIVDDVVTNKFSDEDYLMVVNAGNRQKDWNWLQSHLEQFAVDLSDASDEIALIAFQGPLALSIMEKKVQGIDLSSLKRFGLVRCKVSGFTCDVSRTGYTGEDGFEIAILDTPSDHPDNALTIWNELLAGGRENGVLPCGLGARDSLRLEAGMCLYGNDIDDTTTPIEADLAYVVNNEKEEKYVGRGVIEAQARNGAKRKRVAFSMNLGGIPRHGYEISFSGKRIGAVTSGSYSPTAKIGVGMGYVPRELSEKGQTISVDARGKAQPASIVGTPFYDTKKYGYRRSGA